MKPLFTLLVLSLSFVCEGQTKMEDIDYMDIVEIKGLVYLKADTTLVSGKVIRYNKKKEAKKYILVSKGKPDIFGWIDINDNQKTPQGSTLGNILQAGAIISGAAMAISGNKSKNLYDNTNRNQITNNFTSQKYTSKEYSEMSDRNDISKNLNSAKVKSNGYFEKSNEDGQIIIRGNFIDEKKDGIFEEYYDNSQLRNKGNFIEGKKDGLWKEWYENGKLWSQGNYINGSKTGEWKTYYKNGQLEEIGNYLDEKTIDWRHRDELNKLQVNNNLNMEFKTDEWKTHDESGVMRIENNLDKKKVTESGFNKKNDNGSQGNYINGSKTGEWKTYYKFREYRTGEWKTYHENGQLKEIGYYSGKEGSFNNKTGEWKTYDENSKLTKTENYD